MMLYFHANGLTTNKEHIFEQKITTYFFLSNIRSSSIIDIRYSIIIFGLVQFSYVLVCRWHDSDRGCRSCLHDWQNWRSSPCIPFSYKFVEIHTFCPSDELDQNAAIIIIKKMNKRHFVSYKSKQKMLIMNIQCKALSL